MELDWGVGEIVKALKEGQIYDNTIIVFTSDNGPEKGSAKPLRGKKAQTWEGGHRVPGIITWPNKIPKGKVTHEVISTLDLFPTFVNVAGAEDLSAENLDGKNIRKLLEKPESIKLEDRPLYFYARNGDLEAIRYGKWKLHVAKSRGWTSSTPFEIALYNLEEDISEKNNVASSHSEIVNKLTHLLKNMEQ